MPETELRREMMRAFKAGKLGDYKVGADHTVLLGDPYVFDAKNIGQFNF